MKKLLHDTAAADDCTLQVDLVFPMLKICSNFVDSSFVHSAQVFFCRIIRRVYYKLEVIGDTSFSSAPETNIKS